MKPQNKVTIFMLVMIVMLSIYYFTMPDKSPIDQGNTTDDPKVSLEFQDLRQAKLVQRQAMIDHLYDYIGTDVKPNQVAEALATINELQSLTQNETLLEAELILAGYFDVYVEYLETKDEIRVMVYVYTDTLSAGEIVDIADAAKIRFGRNVNVVTRGGFGTN